MTSIRVDILNPKAAKLLKDLAELELITITEISKNSFKAVLEKLRSNSQAVPSLADITKEVELVRAKRYAK